MATILPWNFIASKKHNNLEVSYLNLREPFQGGPEIGEIEVNSKIIPDKLFGGPLLFYDKFIVVPEFVNTKGFRLAFVNMNTFKVYSVGDIKEMVLLSKIENKEIQFYTDIKNKNLEYYDFSNIEFD